MKFREFPDAEADRIVILDLSALRRAIEGDEYPERDAAGDEEC